MLALDKNNITIMWNIAAYSVYCILLLIVTFILKELFSEKENIVKFKSKFFIFYFLSSCLALVCIPFFVLNPKNIKNSLYAANILKHITKLIGLRWELRNGHVLAEDRGAVIVANHQSTIDVLGMFNIWHVMDKCASIARKEVFYVFPFGLAAYLAGVVFIDRNNARESYRQLEVTSEVMNKNKAKLWLFPEGTRNRRRGLLPFKRGAFKIAIAAQVPVLPLVFSPYYFINRPKLIFGKGHVIIQCLEPFHTKGLTLEDTDALMEKVHSAMELAYSRLTKEVLSALPSDYPITED